ncbi:mismatch DNA repair protein, mutS homologue, putative [Candida dubliniensis CD36]|uniref:DNA mismatch repair protein n=1 Tax=Candida dubliniensis (strain CD36 / ATCC MYA-646 / CBS 7987 / NCPF 3949 / NRRL Y-17841) TaxID=573826 RepID=B9W9U2_CANDC|nr:mismatch DNA repair protein, mutS homologue, putative [Candida dubliniensis CD36]CAX45579.1 mismatch DNA repair protein, mutS homologue, putative [Candida dubliniensis CD36]
MGQISTPTRSSPNAGSNSTGSTKKQSSLMDFFKPMASKDKSKPKQQPSPLSSSPLKSKSNDTKPFLSSDKENDDHSIMDNYKNTTLATSQPDGPGHNQIKPQLASSPAVSKQVEVKKERKQPLKEKTTAALNSSPVASTRRGKKINYAESDDEEEVFSSRKKRRIVQDDSEEEEEEDFKPTDSGSDDDDDMSDFVVDDDDKDEDMGPVSDDDDDDEVVAPKNKTKKPLSKDKPKSSKPNSSSVSGILGRFDAGSSRQSSSVATPKPKRTPISTLTPPKKSFEKENEERYQWLVDIRDAEKRPADHPDYDPRTLYIPQSAWSKFTAFEKQYWQIKSKMWNTVVFFQKGKFYELYENDAVIANTQFDLKIAGGGRANMKLAGIPEMSFEYWAKEFISHGYKVAKVEQKESMLVKQMRGGATKEEKIIERELKGILTGGTLTNLDMISNDMATYCLSIKEEEKEDGTKTFGVAFVDTATSELNFIELDDDAECTKLDTLITQINPKEIICEKRNLCQIATKILKFCAHSDHQIWNALNPITEFWDYDIALEQLVKAKYYDAENLDDYSKYPKVLVDFKDNHQVTFNAFGGLLYYLKLLKLDTSIMSLGNIHEYHISRNSASHMILDGITLNNLEILNNTSDGTTKGTLFKLVNRATTSFGKRQLQKWVLHPLFKVDEINQRYDAVDYLMNDGLELRSILQDTLANIPDLERLLARVHGGTLRFRDFLKVIESFESIASVSSKLVDFTNVESGMLYKYLKSFPHEMCELIQQWEDAFDREQAKTDTIVPSPGTDEEFDNSQASMEDLKCQLDKLLKEYKRTYKSQEICYRDSGKEIYLIEVPFKLKVPSDWKQMGSTSKVKRYYSPEVETLAKELRGQQELHKMVCDTLRLRMYEKFDKHYNVWMQVIQTIANIDCLLALTKASETIGYPSCRPKLIEADKGCIDFKELRHPCFVSTKEFIPNDVQLGGDQPHFGLLTGANAAGKSTLMRTTALAIILSQIGCYIPAESAELTPVDRIMTRLGANDNILQGKSTFFVELSETKKILSNATPRSLVILDELGRGGSSSDGFAIAESVLHHLATHVQSLGFFATHYGTLGLSFKTHPQIKQQRMGIIVDNDSRNITFLYKLETGTAPKSFGMNVASMCGIPDEIVDNAEIAAKAYEQTSKLKKMAEESKGDDISLGLQSDFVWLATGRIDDLSKDILKYDEPIQKSALENIYKMIDKL